jgi:maltose alpha-D-glucosyltransferase/alpha-amylase
MQWRDAPNGGFSEAPPKQVQPPPITRGEYGYPTINVEDQQRDPHSLLAWFSRALHTLRQCPEFGAGECHYIDPGDRSVLAVIHNAAGGAMLALTNLGSRPCKVDLGVQPEQGDDLCEVFADGDYDTPTEQLTGLELRPYGYRWIRLRETLGH